MNSMPDILPSATHCPDPCYFAVTACLACNANLLFSCRTSAQPDGAVCWRAAWARKQNSEEYRNNIRFCDGPHIYYNRIGSVSKVRFLIVLALRVLKQARIGLCMRCYVLDMYVFSTLRYWKMSPVESHPHNSSPPSSVRPHSSSSLPSWQSVWPPKSTVHYGAKLVHGSNSAVPDN